MKVRARVRGRGYGEEGAGRRMRRTSSSMHTPWSLQLLLQTVCRLQSSLTKPGEQRQKPAGGPHSPWPEQSLGHLSTIAEQSSPPQPALQSQTPLPQTPLPLHELAQSASTLQSSPLKPGWHSHRPSTMWLESTTTLHVPRPLQSFLHATVSVQSSPEKPGSHVHVPSGTKHSPCPPHMGVPGHVACSNAEQLAPV